MCKLTLSILYTEKDYGHELVYFIICTHQVVGPFINSSSLLFGDYAPDVMVIANQFMVVVRDIIYFTLKRRRTT